MKPKRKPMYIAAGIAGAGLLAFVLALVFRGKPETRNPKSETNEKVSGQSSVVSGEKTPPVAIQPATTDLKPEAAKPQPAAAPQPPAAEIVAYAKQHGLDPTISLDLGGGVKMEMVLVPAGEFDMGSNDGEACETPVHKVRISRPFYIGKYDVTVAQFRAFANAAEYRTDAEKCNRGHSVGDGKWQEMNGITWRTPGFKQDDDHPVVVVTWNDAQEFCKWATRLAGRTVRLPTEAEWEYAARGSGSPRYPWGDRWEGIMANVADASLRRAGFNMRWGEIKENDGYPFTSPGGAYKNASWCGAYDMAGNVWQWCQDYFSDKYYGESPSTDPSGPGTGEDHVLRGASWTKHPNDCRSARRLRHGPDGRNSDSGFRVVLDSSAPTNVAVQPAPVTVKPETRPWPLHDGKEPVTDYAKRVRLPATETLDLGGGAKLEFVLVPAGTFTMGSPEDEPGREEDGREGPQHEVTITKPFYMGKYEVTVAQFRRFVESTKHVTDAEKAGNKGRGWDGGWKELVNVNWKQPNFPQEDNYPVCLISWNDAQAFVSWAAQATARTVRLPSEAKWEYACRAKTTTRFYVGQEDKDLDKAGWFAGNSGRKTHPVGQKAPNAWGLYDMHGSVFEWCEDRGQKDYYKESPRNDPLGPTAGNGRLFRGGSWFDSSRHSRSAHREWGGPTFRSSELGFRPALDVPAAVAVQPAAANLKPESRAVTPEQLAEYRKRIEAAWPGLGSKLVLKDGRLELTFDGHKQMTDLTPLEGMPLNSLSLWNYPVRNLAPLRGMPLTWLKLRDCRQIEDFGPLAGMKLESLELAETAISDLTPLQGMPLTRLDLWKTPVQDLAPLTGMKLTRLELGRTLVSDLMPLKGLPLTDLDLWGCPNVRELAPLAGMKLAVLGLAGTRVSDLKPLKGMPLRDLGLAASGELRDLTPLEGMSLEKLQLVNPNNITKGLDVVRNMKSLKIIVPDVNSWNPLPAAEFWKKYDAGEFNR
ncbi:MAG: SUMF1/EgtB/PvdO family nonheme iron enzyme [Planctomycetota bacterium]|nr:SUMF1/EgtB/PvdO family nonheme iron enzyme [Planctomycetota bacterium]